MSDSDLRFELLGEVRALRAQTPLELGPAKQRAVLAILLLNAGRPVPVTQIVDAVWGEDPPENGANVVQKYVAGLRRLLDPDRPPRTPGELLPLTSAGYALQISPDDLDSVRFEAGVAQASVQRKSGHFPEAAATLRTALDLWKGEALAGLSGAVFEAARTRLTEAKATAWEKWSEIELARGNHTGVMPDLVRLVEQFPLREGLRSSLMIALHQGGRQAEALAAFREAREYFLDEFGVEPGDKLQETHRRILRGEHFYSEAVDPWSDGSEHPGQYSPPAGFAPPPSGPSSGSPYNQPSGPPYPGAGEPTAPGYYPPPYVPPDLSPPTWTTSGPGWGQIPPLPLRVPRSFPIFEVIAASLIPIIICSVGSWLYFFYAGFYRRDWRQFAVSAGYLALFITACVVMEIDPTPIDADYTSDAEDVGIAMFLAIAVIAAIHGGVLASHPGDSPRARTLRTQAQTFAAYNPGQALQFAVGRPDLIRLYDDGGLVDINHAPPHVLAALPGISTHLAHRIITGRSDRPYARPEELALRGLLTARRLNRVSSWLVCIPTTIPAPATPPWGHAYPPAY
ncbi:hypothetical protein GCM10010435_51640 [Winogradskya consettensis]|uniref:OmpR/PhoB-type domain-containing protein n=1 Tax=Winogradskya consettensis TaxID=113560 RepID=A0A919SJ60_9ACTN|nr:BTAD domain-containing putative transcriptional regulator [Actinoplanes consettensis]GIM71933.1 hypothetical protein Aco04nite_27790 [Actinoplanes consettensis]